jgi:branched-chain amino acid transport system substrate-binding protein
MRRLIIGSLLLCGWATSALAQFSDSKIVIGVMGDQSGVVADVGGPGSILAAHQNKPDIGAFATTSMFTGSALSPCAACSPISAV